jgi:CDP-glucose 4,6-dehydratase
MGFETVFRDATVLVSGNTGFKGVWLSAWLLQMGAKVVGLSVDIPSEPAHFSAASLDQRVDQVWGDVRDLGVCVEAIQTHKPSHVFHMAAQPLVRRSYADPHETFATNMVGTLNMLEAMRLSGHSCSAVFITSDKCYDNVEQLWGYREIDRLGGKDPYSGSKGAAELVIRSYAASYFGPGSPVKVAVGRAGNVIGGGDWAEDRIVPDAVRAWSVGQALQIRNPRATRPWQHVLEPLAGYLTLAAKLSQDEGLRGEAFNFGPPSDQNYSVEELLAAMSQHWPGATWKDVSTTDAVYEAGLLKLCCDKALHRLGWKPLLSFSENVGMTAKWYRDFYGGNLNIWETTKAQIAEYQQFGLNRSAVWAR